MQKNEHRLKATLVVLAICLWGSIAYAADPPLKTYQIGPQPVSAALKAFAAQSDMQLIFTEKDAGGARSRGVMGTKSAREALHEILQGTGLEFEFTANNVVVVRKVAAGLATAGVKGDPPGDDGQKEGKSNSSQDFRVAQVDQASAGPEAVEEKERKFVLEEVVVTGSRLPQTGKEGPQEVYVYTAAQIAQSGQSSVSDFLNTLPNVSVAINESGVQTAFGATSVQLRGLPFGTTLVLLNGRRLESSGSQPGLGEDFFDLNNIPLAAVDRIEVIADGSSAIYGSDAIAGVVNIVLKKNINDLEASVRHGGASGIDQTDTSLALGKQWDRGSISIIGSYLTRSELSGSERSLTASNDYRMFGGPNNNFPTCSPGNIFSVDGVTPLPGLGGATYAAVPTGFAGTPTIQEFRTTAGTLNECPITSGASVIPATHRSGVFGQANVRLTDSVELFTELLYSEVKQFEVVGYDQLFGEPFFQSYTVAPSNPFNPFGTTVGISELLTTVSPNKQDADTTFFRPLVGGRGTLAGDFDWELSAWQSQDHTRLTGTLSDSAAIQGALNSSDPATALNPFVAGAPGPQSQLQRFFFDGLTTFTGRARVINGFVRGPLLNLPSGPIHVAIGGEYDRDTLSFDEVDNGIDPPNTQATYHRNSYAAFAEARIPIVANPANAAAPDTLALTMAGRHDHYNDFGSKNTPQVGIEWRPVETLLLRATYAEAFKAPSLYDLFTAQRSTPTIVNDPARGQQDFVNLVTGGNTRLHPETGQSHTFGLVYSSKVIPDLRLSITDWSVNERNTIETVSDQFVVNNANLFPGSVIRAPTCPGAPPCPITTVIDTQVNFGSIDVAGVDYQLSYKHQTKFGVWMPSLSVAETYKYEATLVPGSPPTNRLSKASDDGAWAPRWKGAIALGWSWGPYLANFDGRYVGRYQDYDSSRDIGKFWLCDANVRFQFGEAWRDSRWTKGLYFELGGVNIFNRLPQYSNYVSSFVGYDPTQADIRGRFIYARVGGTWK